MRSADMSDAVLAAECAEFLDLLASYDIGCKVLEEVEAGAAGAQAVEEVQSGLAVQRRQWLSALHRLGAKPAYTVLGILAKGAAAKGFLAAYPAEAAEAAPLIISTIEDMERLFGTDGRASPRAGHGPIRLRGL